MADQLTYEIDGNTIKWSDGSGTTITGGGDIDWIAKALTQDVNAPNVSPDPKYIPVGEASHPYYQWAATAKPGDVFDWGTLRPEDQGLSNKFIGYNLLGAPMYQTLQTEEYTNKMREQYFARRERLLEAGYSGVSSGSNTAPSNTGGTNTPSTPPAVPPTPPPPPPPPQPVKTAPIDTIIYQQEDIPVEIMADILFENIGGQELINISRNDIVNGQKVVYQPIKNLNSIQQEYNPNNIVALQDAAPQIFANYPISLEEKVPSVGNGPDGSYVYIDPKTGDLVIEAINLGKDEQIEVQITQSGTIYEAEL